MYPNNKLFSSIYNTVRPHSSISYLSPVEFKSRGAKDEVFRAEHIEKRNGKEVEGKCLIR